MRTPLRITLGLLALGASTSVLVAWGCFWLLDPLRISMNPSQFVYAIDDGYIRDWSITSQPGFGTAHLVNTMGASPWSTEKQQSPWIKPSWQPTWALIGFLGKAELTPERVGIGNLFGHRHRVERYELYGWPSSAVARRMAFWRTLPPFLEHTRAYHTHEQYLPTTPIYRGLLLNTLFYAVLWAVLLVLIPSFIRWQRARRGGCPSCGYDTSGLEVCPECGSTAKGTVA